MLRSFQRADTRKRDVNSLASFLKYLYFKLAQEGLGGLSTTVGE